MEINLCTSESINWEAIAAIGQVAGAIATFIAVYVALFEISKTTKPQIKIEIMKIFPVLNNGTLLDEHYNFKIINKGIIAVNVSNLYISLPNKSNMFFIGFNPFVLNPMDSKDYLKSIIELKTSIREAGYSNTCNVKVFYELGSGEKYFTKLPIDL